EAVPVAQQGAKRRRRPGSASGGAQAQLRDALDGHALAPSAGGEMDRLVLEEPAQRITVGEYDAGEAPLAGIEDDGGHDLAWQIDGAVRRPQPEARVPERPAERVAAPQLRRVDVGAAPHLLREPQPSPRRDVGRQGERPDLPALL